MRRTRPPIPLVALAVVSTVAVAGPAVAGPKPPGHGSHRAGPTTTAATAVFSVGEMQADKPGASGCGTNLAGEPALHVSRTNLVVVGSEDGLGGGSEVWRGTRVGGSRRVTACGLTYAGQPNAIAGFGASGGDIDVAIAPQRSSAGTYRIYAASLNLASVNVATSVDNGATWTQVPAVEGIPVDDREWIAAWGADTALLSYHDIVTDNVNVLRSDDGGQTFVQLSRAIPDGDYRAMNNQHGNLVIDHVSRSPVAGGFWAYQSFVAPSTSSGSDYNEAFVSVSNDGGATWTVRPVPCSVAKTGLDHNFPNISVAPDGSLWYAWSDDRNVSTAVSRDHGTTWTCSGPVSRGTRQAIFPWLVATSRGVDLVYYGTPNPGGKQAAKQVWYVYFAQDPSGRVNGWSAPQRLVAVHKGAVCESGVTCTNGRQLLDDFAVDTDQAGWAHIAFSHDAPGLGGSDTFTGYAVQVGGTRVGAPN